MGHFLLGYLEEVLQEVYFLFHLLMFQVHLNQNYHHLMLLGFLVMHLVRHHMK
jgi:hypothetical protein